MKKLTTITKEVTKTLQVIDITHISIESLVEMFEREEEINWKTIGTITEEITTDIEEDDYLYEDPSFDEEYNNYLDRSTAKMMEYYENVLDEEDIF